MTVLDEMNAFLRARRQQLDNAESNLLAQVFGEVPRYYEFLRLILQRCADSGDRYLQGHERFMARLEARSLEKRQLDAEDETRRQRMLELQAELQLDIESFYVFGNILLDRVASATEHCLGSTDKPAKSFASFKHLEDYARERGLPEPTTELREAAASIWNDLSKFRHDYVVHKHETDFGRRLVAGQAWDRSREVSLSYGLFYAKEGETTETANPAAVGRRLDLFLSAWLKFLATSIAAQ